MNHHRAVFALALILCLLISTHTPAAPVQGAGLQDAAAHQSPFPPDGLWTDEFKTGGPNGTVYAMARDPFSGDLYVGGRFTSPGENVARWDGAQWWPVKNGVDNQVNAMVFDSKGMLYVGTSACCIGSPVSRWDGVKWTEVRSTSAQRITGIVVDMAVDSQDRLYIVGSSIKLGSFTETDLLMWDGNHWQMVGNYIFNPLGTIAVDSHDNVYVGMSGSGGAASGIPNFFMKWDGTRWNQLGSGLALNSADAAPWVTSLEVGPDDQVYVGGRFDTAGGLPSLNVAVWGANGWTALGGGPAGGSD